MGIISPNITLDFYHLNLSNVYIAVADNNITIQKSNCTAFYSVWSSHDARLSNSTPIWSTVINTEYTSDDIYSSVYSNLKELYPGSVDC